MKVVGCLIFFALLPVLLLVEAKPSSPKAYDVPNIDEDNMPPAPRGEPFEETETDAMTYILDDNDPIEQEIADGDIPQVLIDGDIYEPVHNESSRSKRNAVKGRDLLWPGGLVPYAISPYFHTDSKLAVLAAMQRFHDRTCIRFRPRTIEKDFIYVGPGRGCWSLVGRQGSRQSVSLGATCKTKRGTVMHELMHVLGFRHEHNRPDRDSHVVIYWDNIAKPMQMNFKKYPRGSVDLLGVGYDFGSIMHYPMYAFSTNGAATLSPRYTTYQEVGFRNDFSDLDVYRINTLYKCGACQDTDHNHCPTWAMGGSCHRNREWMSKNCPFSCMMCKTNSYGACKDTHSSCKPWAKVGECRRNPPWMKKTCPLSCGGCPMDLRNRQDEIVGYCHDSTSLCPDWAYLGECRKNKGFMRKKCKYSCGTCQADDKTPNPWTFMGDKRECRDLNPFCPKWAEIGQCSYNPSVMRKECKESCNLCPKIPDCYDKYDSKECKRWAWHGDCLSNPEGTKGICKKSCGQCGEREGCRDLNKRCIKWAKAGECTKATSIKFMRKFCAPSCGICTPSAEETLESKNVIGSEQGATKNKKKAKKPPKTTLAPTTTTDAITTAPPETTAAPEPVKKTKKGKKKNNKKKKKAKKSKKKKAKALRAETRQLISETGAGALRPDSRAGALRPDSREVPGWKIARMRRRLEKAVKQSQAMDDKRASKRAETEQTTVTGVINIEDTQEQTVQVQTPVNPVEGKINLGHVETTATEVEETHEVAQDGDQNTGTL